MLQQLRTLFYSTIKSLEILYLLEDIKPAARIMVKEDEKDKILGFLEQNRIHCILSDFKVIKTDAEKEYSDKGAKAPANSEEKGHFFAYVSKDRETAERAKELEQNNKHRELGRLLGYPECCSEFFERHFEEESKRNNDFTLAALKNSNGFQFPFHTNIAARHFDIALLSHFPCNFNCKASVELANKNLEIIKKHDAQTAEIIGGMLKGAVLYTENNGVFLLRYPELRHQRLYYKVIMASMDNQLHNSLKNAEYLEIAGNNAVVLDNFTIKNIGIMLFS